MVRDTQTFADWPEAVCKTGGPGPAVAVWGDSYAAHYFDALRAYAERAGRPLTLAAESSCPPIEGLPVPNRPGCERFNQGVVAYLLAARPSVLIVSADWMIYEKKKTVAESFVDKFVLLERTLSRLKAAAIRIIVIGPSPVFSAPAPRIAAAATSDQTKASASRKFDEFFRKLAANGVIEYVPAYTSFCTEAMYCKFREGGELLFWDTGHLTKRGAEPVVARVAELIASR